MKRIDTDERRRRLAVRHHVAPACRAASLVEAAGDLVGIHASDPGSVYLEVLARVKTIEPEDIQQALYDDRSVLKILGMRRTMFVVPVDVAAIIQAACTRGIGAVERRRTLAMLEGAGISDEPAAWLAEVEKATVEVLERLGEATAAELSRAVPGLREQIPFGAGKKWQGTVGVSTRLLFLLAAEGRIIRGRPKGSWVSSLYRWAPMNGWLTGGLPDLPTPDAQAEIVRRWLRAFGPGTARDIQWWTGWTVAETKRALAGAKAVEVALDEGIGFVLPNDLEATPPPRPWIALLPALDATTMGWTSRSWYLGEHVRTLFDRNGNAGPTIWSDGRVVGGWAQLRSGEIVTRLLEDPGASTRRAIEKEAERIARWLGEIRIIPRFRTPLEQELTG